MSIINQHFSLPDPPDYDDQEEMEDDFEVPEEKPISKYYAPDYMDERGLDNHREQDWKMQQKCFR